MDMDEKWMRLALEQARLAAEEGEVPVGAVVVRGEELLASTHNLCERQGMATAHAELLAIEAACKKTGSWRLSDCTLYVTLEPCPMCAGAIVNARIPRVVFASKDPKAGRLLTCRVKEGRTERKKFGNTPDKCFIFNEDVTGVECPPELDKDWYISEAKKRLKHFGLEG